jgi:hypothetical protein
MEDGLFRIRRKTLVPAIYRIYLNPDDYEPFRDIVPFIAGEIRAVLDEKLAGWNGSHRKMASSFLAKVGIDKVGDSAGGTEYVRVSDSWTVEIYPDLDGKLQPGEIEVYSELGSPQKTEYGAGSLTRRIFPKKAEEPPEPGATALTFATLTADQTSEPKDTSVAETPVDDKPVEDKPAEDKDEQTKGRAFAYLRYADQQGNQVFDVTKNQVVIGRGGRSYWVDLKLETLPDVSREHCRIRRDAETGRFSIEDVSQFGTAVNGKPVGRNASAELPRRATISLAGVVDLQWEAV